MLLIFKPKDIVIGAWQKEDEDTDVRKVSYFLHLNSFKTVGVEERQVSANNGYCLTRECPVAGSMN